MDTFKIAMGQRSVSFHSRKNDTCRRNVEDILTDSAVYVNRLARAAFGVDCGTYETGYIAILGQLLGYYTQYIRSTLN
jgi:hypothetical protein